MQSFIIKMRFVISVSFILIGLGESIAQDANVQKCKYVFLFIGDGMGLNQVFLTEEYLDSFGKDSLIFLNPEWKWGLLQTGCQDSFRITDSGAAGTAIACGSKTNYGKIGMTNNTSLQSVAEYLKEKNFKIGIITSVPLNHATPACFYGHESTRKNYDNLTEDLIESDFDFFAGGGFLLGNSDTSKSLFNNFEEVLMKLEEKKFRLALNPGDLELLHEVNNSPVIVIDTIIRNKQQEVKGTYSDEINAFPYVIDFPEHAGLLAEYTNIAIKTLFNDTGFFLMVEGGKIDWACHENDAATMVHEIIAFNSAIKKAYEFYLQYPDQTLIIVTADHETGGLSLGTGFNDYEAAPENSYAFYPSRLARQNKSLLFSDSSMIAKINYDAQVGWTTSEHTGAAVGLWSIGTASNCFSGIYENSEIKNKIIGLIK